VEAFGAGTAAIVSPVNKISYLSSDVNIPVGAQAGEMMGRADKLSMADKVKQHLLDIQVCSVKGLRDVVAYFNCSHGVL
jgi:hypothetical protein